MDLTDTLEKDLARIIGFIGNCDTKASIVLGSTLASVSLMIGLCGAKLLDSNSSGGDVVSYVVSALFAISMILISFGLCYILMAIYAKIDSYNNGSDKNSVFFGDIASISPEEYRKTIMERDTEGYIQDLIAQIWINAKRCTEKYRLYDNGLACLVMGILLMMLAAIILIEC